MLNALLQLVSETCRSHDSLTNNKSGAEWNHRRDANVEDSEWALINSVTELEVTDPEHLFRALGVHRDKTVSKGSHLPAPWAAVSCLGWTDFLFFSLEI